MLDGKPYSKACNNLEGKGKKFRFKSLGLHTSIANMKKAVSQFIQQSKAQNRKQLAVLVDPDKLSLPLIGQLDSSGVDLLFFGGSLLSQYGLNDKIASIRQHTRAKVVLFPGSIQQISAAADAILFLSLVSGRNPELLIGQQVLAAPMIKQAGLETLSTGYMLVDGGSATTAVYMSGSLPLPANKPEIAAVTAMAAEMLGMQHIYLDAGSGAKFHPPLEMISAIRAAVKVPIIVGGGIRTPEMAYQIAQAGADILVVGNVLEEHPSLLTEMAAAVQTSVTSF